MSIEIMKQALEALETCGESETYDGDMECYYSEDKVDAAITALRLAIEQAEKQEPTPAMIQALTEQYDSDRAMGIGFNPQTLCRAVMAVQPQQEKQEPVAWKNAAIRLGEELSSVGPDGYYDMSAEKWLDWAMNQQPLGKNSLPAPPQRQPLTEEEIALISAECALVTPSDIYFARAIEAAHGITGEKK
jgi:hypothetical protein